MGVTVSLMVVIEMRTCTIDTMNTMSQALMVKILYIYIHVGVTASLIVVVGVRTFTIDTINTMSQALKIHVYIYMHTCGSDSQSNGSDRGEDIHYRYYEYHDSNTRGTYTHVEVTVSVMEVIGEDMYYRYYEYYESNTRGTYIHANMR